MPDGIRWVGLDVHARESTLAVFDQATGEVLTRRVVGRPHELLPWLRGVERPTRMVYEAGPTGYGLARRARAVGIELGVCAPGKTERPPADRVKTDKRDAIRLARLLAAGELTLVTIPVGGARAAARSGALSGRHPRGSDARPASDREVPVAPRDLLGGPRGGVDAQASLMADLGAVRRSGLAGDHGGLPARSRPADRPPRPGRGPGRFG
jgi:hypothetical protein